MRKMQKKNSATSEDDRADETGEADRDPNTVDIEFKSETYDSVITYAQSLIRNCILINSGALVVSLTALGNSSRAFISTNFSAFTWAANGFAIGLICAGLASYLAYCTQFALYRRTINVKPPLGLTAKTLRNWTATMAFASLLSFFIGCYGGVLQLKKPPAENTLKVEETK